MAVKDGIIKSQKHSDALLVYHQESNTSSSRMELAIVGLQNAGKTSLLRVLAGEDFMSDALPTIGFNLKQVQHGHVTLNCWDVAGQPRFRESWERYCSGVTAIIFVVDAADEAALTVAKEELHGLLDKPGTRKVPLLVLANKSDLPGKLPVDTIIDRLEMASISGRELSCYAVSAKEETNLDAVLSWLIDKRH